MGGALYTANGTFIGLSETAWVAIASILSALSVISLIVFNIAYLKTAQRQAQAAAYQSITASKSLVALQDQIKEKSVVSTGYSV